MRKIIACLLTGLLLTLSFARPSQAATPKYYVEPTQFNAAFQIMDRGLSNIIGLFQSATAAFAFDGETQTISNLRLAIDTSSIMVPNQRASDDMQTLLAIRDYPELTFMATAPQTFKDGKSDIKGTLTVHGQKKEAVFHATLNTAQKSKIGMSLHGVFKRADFGMADEPEMPGRFGDTITLMLEMQAIKS
ncbi:MAG: YceI family protein [Alphaproteobacteria bacterium]|nr:YceI family protein [Alphaproteobacteria bacterium]